MGAHQHRAWLREGSAGPAVILTVLDVGAAEFEQETGWAIKTEGACRGDLCIPLAPRSASSAPSGAGFDLAGAADRLGMALVHEPEVGLWALGPASVGGRALTTAEAPELELPDFDGNPFRLSSLRGQKVVLVAWAPY
jgi:hypothetical protein